MEKRIGVIAILITEKPSIPQLNSILSSHNELIIGRQGMPLREKGISVISLIVEGTTDEISSLCGKLGKLKGVQVKSVLTKFKENGHELNIDEPG
jgi:putative iron-only hydrogenase system regulator